MPGLVHRILVLVFGEKPWQIDSGWDRMVQPISQVITIQTRPEV